MSLQQINNGESMSSTGDKINNNFNVLDERIQAGLDCGVWNDDGVNITKSPSILNYRQLGNNPLPTTLLYGQIGICEDSTLVVGDVDNNPKELKTIFPKKICEFNSAGTYTWVVPKDMIIDIYILGAGGAGGGSDSVSSTIYFGGAGASGFGKNIVSISVKK